MQSDKTQIRKRTKLRHTRNIFSCVSKYRHKLGFRARLSTKRVQREYMLNLELTAALNSLVAAFAVFFITSNVDVHIQVFVIISVIGSILQIIACEIQSLKLRHWTTFINAFAVSMIVVFLCTRTSLDAAEFIGGTADFRYVLYKTLRTASLIGYTGIGVLLIWLFYKTGARLRLTTFSH